MSGTDDGGINVLSLNCWGLKWISKYRATRLDAIANTIARSSYDIVALQEIWVYTDFENLVKQTRHILPYSKFYFSGVLGGGLAILSKWPIESTTMWQYPLNGRPTAFWRGDWYVGKGVASALIRHSSGKLIEIFNTHLHAPYGKGENTYLCHRLAQTWHIAKLLRSSVQRGNIAVGDFNIAPGSLGHTIITGHGLVTDSWLALHPDSPPWPYTFPPNSPHLSAAERIQKLGVTSNSNLNTWRANRNDSEGIRLDYVFVNQSCATVEDCTVVFTEPVTSHRCSYSDHFGINVKLQLIPIKDDCETVTDDQLFSSEMFDSIEGITGRYIVRELRFSRRRVIHFFASLVAFAALVIAQWWVEPRYGHFIITIGAILVTVTGIVNGIIGFIFGRWEIHALREFLSDVQFARKVYLGGTSRM